MHTETRSGTAQAALAASRHGARRHYAIEFKALRVVHTRLAVGRAQHVRFRNGAAETDREERDLLARVARVREDLRDAVLRFPREHPRLTELTFGPAASFQFDHSPYLHRFGFD